MRSALFILTVAAAAIAAVAASRGSVLPASSAATAKGQGGFLLLPRAAAAGELTLYGHVRKLTRSRGHFELLFDPAWFTMGLTAKRANLADTGSGDVPNDNYVVEAGHRLLTYVVSTSAHITVLTNNGTGISSTPISVAELARIVNGVHHRKLFEPLASGVWIRVHIDVVRSLDQQYQP
jgi:hypothetical protein